MDIFIVRDITFSKVELPFNKNQVIKQDDYLNVNHYLKKIEQFREEKIKSIFVKYCKFNNETKRVDAYFIEMDLDYVIYIFKKFKEDNIKYCIIKLKINDKLETVVPYFSEIEKDVLIGSFEMHCGDCDVIDCCAEGHSDICLCYNKHLKEMSIYDYFILYDNDEVNKLYIKKCEKKKPTDKIDEYQLKVEAICEIFNKLEKK